jgi:hypothetical protein
VNLLAVVGEIDAKVHEIVLSKARFVDNGFQLSLVELVRNVSEHNLRMYECHLVIRTELFGILTVVRTSVPCWILLISTWLW